MILWGMVHLAVSDRQEELFEGARGQGGDLNMEGMIRNEPPEYRIFACKAMMRLYGDAFKSADCDLRTAPSDPDPYWKMGWTIRENLREDKVWAMDRIQKLPPQARGSARSGLEAFDRWYGL